MAHGGWFSKTYSAKQQFITRHLANICWNASKADLLRFFSTWIKAFGYARDFAEMAPIDS
jgi:hypothetical protein